jgi:hypothetical protein
MAERVYTPPVALQVARALEFTSWDMLPSSSALEFHRFLPS